FRGLALLGGAIGLLALAMALVGLYGVMSFAVSQRTREIGIRVAIGASARSVITLVLRQGFRVVLVGLMAGAMGGALLSRLLTRAMVGLGRGFDAPTFGLVIGFFAVVALVACLIPARRAATVDPAVALRRE